MLVGRGATTPEYHKGKVPGAGIQSHVPSRQSIATGAGAGREAE